MRTHDKVAIVTGGAMGIGEGISLRLAAEGAKVAVLDVNLEGAQKTAQQIEKAGGTALAIKVDVSRAVEVEAAARKVVSTFKKIDILVNNAGVSQTSKVASMTEEMWDKVNNVNLKGVFLCCHAVIPYMKQRKYGKIVNIASVLALTGSAYYAHYGATKAGVVGFTRGLAVELGPHNINVNAVGPGVIDTPMAQQDVTEALRQRLQKRIPMRRIGMPRDIADAVSFLASDEASYITGQCLYVCGGLSADAALW